MSRNGSYTVAICAYNREIEIALCLVALARVLNGRRDVPVIVVDNNSRDRTAAVAQGFFDRLNLRVIPEPKQGLSHARDCAVAACETEYIIFLDDDAKPKGTWIRAIEEAIADGHPDVFGGPYGPFYLSPKPRWFKDAYGSMHFDLPRGPIPPGRTASGGNMGIRVEAVHLAGGFPADLGMTGGSIGVGEETQLQHRLRALLPTYRAEFHPAMEIEHLVPDYKFPLSYWTRRWWKEGWTTDDVNAKPVRFSPLALARQLVRLVLMPFEYLLRDRKALPYWQNYVFERLRERIRYWAWLCRRVAGPRPKSASQP